MQKQKGYAHLSHSSPFQHTIRCRDKGILHFSCILSVFSTILYLMSKMKTKTCKSQLCAHCLYTAKSEHQMLEISTLSKLRDSM